MAKQPERLAELHRLLHEALIIADDLALGIIAIRISEALEITREMRAQIPSRVPLKVVNSPVSEPKD
jgi:hypothetical protein